MMLNRSNDVELDFDFDRVLEKNKDNPVFYVQYSFARISSIFRTLGKNLGDGIKIEDDKLDLNNNEEKILRKIFEWPKVIQLASSKYEPHRIPYYLYELATLFHSYWSRGNIDQNYKFIDNGKIKKETLIVIMLVAIVIQEECQFWMFLYLQNVMYKITNFIFFIFIILFFVSIFKFIS